MERVWRQKGCVSKWGRACSRRDCGQEDKKRELGSGSCTCARAQPCSQATQGDPGLLGFGGSDLSSPSRTIMALSRLRWKVSPAQNLCWIQQRHAGLPKHKLGLCFKIKIAALDIP